MNVTWDKHLSLHPNTLVDQTQPLTPWLRHMLMTLITEQDNACHTTKTAQQQSALQELEVSSLKTAQIQTWLSYLGHAWKVTICPLHCAIGQCCTPYLSVVLMLWWISLIWNFFFSSVQFSTPACDCRSGKQMPHHSLQADKCNCVPLLATPQSKAL